MRDARGELSGRSVIDAALAAVVSVVIPAFNQAAYLGDALDSLLAQTLSRWECVVVDDGSSDETPAVVEGYARRDSRIRYARQANAGPSAARNAGLALATGEFVQFLDADDVLGPRKLERHVRVLGENPSADLVYGRSRYFSGPASDVPSQPGNCFTDPDRPTPSGSGVPLTAALLGDNPIVIEAPLFQRALVVRVGAFDPTLRKMEDWEFWLRCALGGAVFLFDPSTDPDTFAYVRVHEMSSSRHSADMKRSQLVIRRRLATELRDPRLVRLNKRRTNESLARSGMAEGARGDMAVGMRSLIRAGWAERRVEWLAMGAALPVLRLPLAQRTARAIRTLRRRVRQGHRPR